MYGFFGFLRPTFVAGARFVLVTFVAGAFTGSLITFLVMR